MADNKLSELSKKELAEAVAKLKGRQQRAARAAREEGEALVRDAITVATAGGLGYYMGMQEKDRPGDETAVQVAGIDIDLLVGGAAAAAGLMKLGGKMSDTLRAVGIGGLSSYASRLGHDKALEAE